LTFSTPFQLLAATILSAQCTDERVNLVTPFLFERFPTPETLAVARQEDIEAIVHATGFFRAKASNLIAMAQRVCAEYGGIVPTELADLTTLAGVGRKTGNVLRSVAFDLPGLPVDTHVTRLVHRLDITKESDPVKIEYSLNEFVPPSNRGGFSLRLILHGRAVCNARRPNCAQCLLADFCPKVGVR
jgi:endonuclease-3